MIFDNLYHFVIKLGLLCNRHRGRLVIDFRNREIRLRSTVMIQHVGIVNRYILRNATDLSTYVCPFPTVVTCSIHCLIRNVVYSWGLRKTFSLGPWYSFVSCLRSIDVSYKYASPLHSIAAVAALWKKGCLFVLIGDRVVVTWWIHDQIVAPGIKPSFSLFVQTLLLLTSSIIGVFKAKEIVAHTHVASSRLKRLLLLPHFLACFLLLPVHVLPPRVIPLVVTHSRTESDQIRIWGDLPLCLQNLLFSFSLFRAGFFVSTRKICVEPV